MARGILLCTLRSPADGACVLEGALPIAERVGAVRTRENALQVLAGVYLIQGELAKGRVLVEQAIRLAEAQEDRAMLVVHLAQLARYAFVAGDWLQAHTHLARAADIVRSIGPAWYTVLPLTQLGVLLEAEGDWEGASRYFEQVLSATESGRVARGAPLARIIPAEMDIRQGRPERAVQRLAPLLAQAEADWANGTLTLASAAWAHLEAGDPGADALVERALALAEKTSNRIDRVGALRVLALLRHRAGAREEAERLFGEAVALAAAIPYPYAAGRTLYDWGMARAAAGEPEEGRRRLTEALTIFRRLGAHKDVELAERALEALASV
jgi:tetratricopeptide (TPR) repeat protein